MNLHIKIYDPISKTTKIVLRRYINEAQLIYQLVDLTNGGFYIVWIKRE